MKTCFKCGETKSIADYYKHPAMGDGHLGKCKDCTKRDVQSNRRRNNAYYLEYDRKRGNRQSIESHRKYRRDHPERYKATSLLGTAVKSGVLVKEPCFFCGAEKVVGHHHDYSKPLDVTWLCQRCHKRLHTYLDKTA